MTNNEKEKENENEKTFSSPTENGEMMSNISSFLERRCVNVEL